MARKKYRFEMDVWELVARVMLIFGGLSFVLGVLQRLMQNTTLLTFKTKSTGEDWTTALGWFIPRKYRNDIIGDILEDCADMRKIGCTERRIKFHVMYQWLIAVVTLVPTAIKTSITDILKQVLSPPK